MLTYSDLKKGVQIILEGEPYEILESSPLKKAQRRVVIHARIKSLINGKVLEKNFHQGDTFKEADIQKKEVKFLYSHHDKFVFSEKDNPLRRFELKGKEIGGFSKFLKPGQPLEIVEFKNRVINVSLPIKINLRVVEAPPGIKGNRAEGGTKQVTLETGAKINAPLFIKEGDIIEINTESGEYVRRFE